MFNIYREKNIYIEQNFRLNFAYNLLIFFSFNQN